MRKILLTAIVAVCTLSGVAAYLGASANAKGWQEITWPFPRDGWPAGRAFRCDVVSCGDDVELYLRPKIGFCNCDSGIADDDEVDRVADLDLVSERFVALEAGRVIEIADMSGRIRTYSLRTQDGSEHTALGIALSRRCDLLVVAALGKTRSAELQHIALDFLSTEDVTRSMKAALAGR